MSGKIARAYFLLIIDSYGELINSLWKGTSSSISPSSFKSVISKFARQFSGYNQNDAQEFLAFLLDGLHEDLNQVKKKPYVEDASCDGKTDLDYSIECWDNYLLRNKSIIVNLFQGQLKITIHCLTCNYTTIKFDPFMYLSLPIDAIKSSCSLIDCINKFITEEKLNDKDQWYCPKCKGFQDSTIKYDLWKLPYLLIIHFKRFSYNRYGYRTNKIDEYINYPLTGLDLSGFTNYPDPAGNVYDLFAVSCHHGSTGGGHYTANCYHKYKRQWYKYNDSMCSELSENDALTSSAYMLFYTKVSVTNGRRYTVDLADVKPEVVRPKGYVLYLYL